MVYGWLADLTAWVHFGFVVFVVVGGLLVLYRRWWAWVHLPAALWGVAVEWSGSVCPLTPLENWLRLRAGAAGYRGGFVEHYLLPLLYPSGLSREVQIVLGFSVLVINLVIYGFVWRRWRTSGRKQEESSRWQS